MKNQKSRLLILAILLCPFIITSAQDGYIVKNDSLHSLILSQNRKLEIWLPVGYDTLDAKFPVIYVLDADGRDQHIVPTARFLFLNGKMPKAIIVGVRNIDRNHDFLSDSTRATPTGGGADKFIDFFHKELIPFIEKNYHTEQYKVLIGHSYGGLFALHVLIKEPELFDAYIAIDPSIWYKNLIFLKNAEAEFTKTKKWDRSVFIAGRDGEGMNEMGITSLEKLIKASTPKELNWKISAYADEDHGSVTFKSAYDGLRYIFDAGGALKVYPDAGIVPAGMPFDVYLWNLSPDMRYTTDGSEPTVDSPQCQAKMELKGGCILKIKNLTRKYKNYPTATFTYKEEDFFHGLKSPDKLKSGLRYEYFEGVWDSLPDFSRTTPVKRGITENIDLNPAVKKDSFALRFDGYLYVKEKEIYYIWITSDDGSEIYINNRLVIKNDGLHAADLPKVAVVPLSPGYYPFIIKYFEKGGEQSLAAGMIKGKETPAPQPFAKETLFYKE